MLLILITSGLIYIALGIMFAIYGAMILRVIIKYFKSFYQSYSCLLMLPLLGLTIPFVTRGAFNLVRAYYPKWSKITSRHPVTYMMLQFFIGDVLPLLF